MRQKNKLLQQNKQSGLTEKIMNIYQKIIMSGGKMPDLDDLRIVRKNKDFEITDSQDRRAGIKFSKGKKSFRSRLIKWGLLLALPGFLLGEVALSYASYFFNSLSFDRYSTNITRTWNRFSFERSPSWSPDGKKIAFISREYSLVDSYVGGSGSLYEHLFTMAPDGSNRKKRLYKGYSCGRFFSAPVWTEDSKRIYCLALSGGEGSLVWDKESDKMQYIEDGFLYPYKYEKKPEGIEEKIGEVERCEYSPNKEKIAFSLENKLFMADSDGKNKMLLADNYFSNKDSKKGRTGGFSWSPDGKYIAYTGCLTGTANGAHLSSVMGYAFGERDDDGDMFLIELETRKITNLTESCFALEHNPRWSDSPDGKNLFFLLEDPRLRVYDVELNEKGSLPLDKKMIKKDLLSKRDPRISPDGKMKVSGNAIEYLESGRKIDVGYDMTYPQWSPDSKWVAFSGVEDVKLRGEHRIFYYAPYIASAENGKKVKLFGQNRYGHDRHNFTPSWSPDVKYLAFGRRGDIWLYDWEAKKRELK